MNKLLITILVFSLGIATYASAAVTSTNWQFTSDAEGWTSVNANFTFDSATGTPSAGSLRNTCVNSGAGCTSNGYWEITKDWTGLFGIPWGSTVNQVLATSTQTASSTEFYYTTNDFSRGDWDAGEVNLSDELNVKTIPIIIPQKSGNQTNNPLFWTNVTSTAARNVPIFQQDSYRRVKLRMWNGLTSPSLTVTTLRMWQDNLTIIIDYTPPGEPRVELAGLGSMVVGGQGSVVIQ